MVPISMYRALPSFQLHNVEMQTANATEGSYVYKEMNSHKCCSGTPTDL